MCEPGECKTTFSQEAEEFIDLSFSGLLLSDRWVPEEVVIKILSFISWSDLLSCRSVCTTWKRLIDTGVCYEKLRNKCKNSLSKSLTDSNSVPNFGSFPFYLNFAIGKPNYGLGYNLLKNVFGNEGGRSRYKFWKKVESGGNGWRVESSPLGCDPLPEELKGTSCFVTSYGLCYKTQLIDLRENGLHPKIMDEVQPEIEVSEWYAARFDCGVLYKMKVTLLDANREPITEFEEERMLLAGTEWYKISHTFSEYGPGVRYVLFGHGGKDTQFWAGHYGSKMAGAEVVARLPKHILNHNFDNN